MSTASRRQAEFAEHLTAQTLAWLADRPPVRSMLRSVWNQLAALERAGHDPGALRTLRSVLLDHQPTTRTGHCRTCPRLGWRRRWRRFPCRVWLTTHLELQGFFRNTPRR